jgi:hypothetical protein
MDPVACGQCGKQDDESNMFVCSGCFEFHFCSEAHFDAHPHSRIADAQHFTEVDVGVNVRRIFKKGDYRNALEILAHTYFTAIQAGGAGTEITDSEWMSSLEAFLRELSKKEQSAFIKSYTNFINQLKTTLFAIFDEARKSLAYSSKEIVDIFVRENRLSLRQRKQAIENAWWRFIDALLMYHTSSDRQKARNDINDMAVVVGRILGGGKDVYKVQK